VNNVIYLTDGEVTSLARKKLKELNEGSRNHFIIKVFVYNHNGEVKLHFTLIDGPEVIKERTFKPNKVFNTINVKDNMTLSRASQPWRTKEYLDKIVGIPFYGSVGRGNDSEQYWLMYVGGGNWVNSEGDMCKTANTVMKQVRIKSFVKVYGEEKLPNLSVWAHHKNSNGFTIDEELRKLYFVNH
jgi:hypothetical protein